MDLMKEFVISLIVEVIIKIVEVIIKFIGKKMNKNRER